MFYTGIKRAERKDNETDQKAQVLNVLKSTVMIMNHKDLFMALHYQQRSRTHCSISMASYLKNHQ